MQSIFKNSKELTKFLIICIMMMIIVYVYSILRVSKDAIIVSLIGEAELISTLKLYAVLPSAIIFMLVYTKLVDVFSKIQLFNIITWFFVGFFGLFAFVLFPNVNYIHFDMTNAIEKMPYMKYIFLMLGKWSYSLFYIFSELWGSVMLSLLFWQLANSINTVEEAKKFYPLFGFSGQLGLFLSGELMKIFNSIARNSNNTIEMLNNNIVSSSHQNWSNSLIYISSSIIIAGLLLSLMIYILSKTIGSDLINGVVTISNKPSKKKIKMGFVESLKYIMSSKYIGLITLLILCYGVSINLVEGIWKKSAGIMYPNPLDYADFNADVQRLTSIATIITMLTGSFVLRLVSWRTAAMFTPIMIFLTGFPFFLFMIYQDNMTGFLENMGYVGYGALLIAVMSGAAQNILSKSTKYAFFDSTKEMSYIPLEDDLKVKGKAAADVIGGRLGKSGGAFIQAMMLQVFIGSTLIDIAPYMFVIFIVIMIVWFFSVFKLSNEFKLKMKNSDAK